MASTRCAKDDFVKASSCLAGTKILAELCDPCSNGSISSQSSVSCSLSGVLVVESSLILSRVVGRDDGRLVL